MNRIVGWLIYLIGMGSGSLIALGIKSEHPGRMAAAFCIMLVLTTVVVVWMELLSDE